VDRLQLKGFNANTKKRPPVGPKRSTTNMNKMVGLSKLSGLNPVLAKRAQFSLLGSTRDSTDTTNKFKSLATDARSSGMDSNKSAIPSLILTSRADTPGISDHISINPKAKERTQVEVMDSALKRSNTAYLMKSRMAQCAEITADFDLGITKSNLYSKG